MDPRTAGRMDKTGDARWQPLIESSSIQTSRVLISEMISVRARNLTVRYARSRGLTIPDALIAATTIATRALLLTRNVRHYSFIPHLQVRLPYDSGE